MVPPMARRPARTPITPRTASRLYVVLGVFALLGCVALALYPQLALRGAHVTQATVVALRGDDAGGWTPVVQFTAPDGGLIRWSGGDRRKPAAYAVGDRLRMVYAPDNPGAIGIAGFWTIYAPAVAVGVFGLLFLGFGLLGARAARRLP